VQDGDELPHVADPVLQQVTDTGAVAGVQQIRGVAGLDGLYALMAVVNAAVIAGAERRREFAVARVTGLTRRQVVGTAVAEAVAVAVIGVVLGCVVAGAGLAGIGGAVHKAIGVTVVHVPWTLLTIVAIGSVVVVVAATSGITAAVATRERPVSLVAAEE
jgi:putative ABC transport system permease protein